MQVREPPTVAGLQAILNQRLHVVLDEAAWLTAIAKDLAELEPDDATRRRIYHNILTKGA